MILSLIATKLKRILTMRKAIVVFVVSLIFIAVPLITALAQPAAPAAPQGSNLATKILATGPLLILGAIVSSYVNLLGLLSLQLIHFLIEILKFNDFINFGPVIIGWTIVRDVVNMSFVIILLVIAISTILNIEAYSYRRLLPKLVLMAVLINFSRTIAGLLIDVGQVFMLTFVNAFSATAGGNFLNALHVNDLLGLGVSDLFNSSISASSIFAAYLLAAIAITVTFITLLAFVGIILFRVLTLWFLIILSPLAFAVAAWPSAKANKYYGEWWSKFTDNIIVGPILAFFLWLALMMMSADYITTLAPGIGGSGAESSGAIPSPGTITDLSAPKVFASFLLGIGTLIMVLKMVSSMQVAFAGFGMKALDYAKTKGVAAAKLLGKGALLGAAAGAGAVGSEAARRISLARGGTGEVTPVTERGLSFLTNVPIVRGWARGKLGEARGERSKAFGAEGAKLAEMTPAELDRLRNQRPPILTPDIAAKRGGQLYKLLTDKQYQKHLKDTYGEAGADEKMRGVMSEYNEVTKVGTTPEIARKAMDVKKFRPDLLPANSPDFKNLVDNMEAEDVKKLTADTFTKTMDRGEMSAGTKAAWAQYAMSGSPALRGAALKYRADHPPAEDELFAEFTQRKLDNKLRVTDVGVDEMKNSKIVVEVATNQKNYSGELNDLLKRNDTRTAMRETLLRARADRLAGKVKDADGNVVPAIVGTGEAATYTPAMQGITETALRAGASLEQTYNIDVNTSSFKEVAERNAFSAALKGNNRVDIVLNSNLDGLSVNNYDNQISESVAKSLNYQDVREMMSKAKESGEQDNVFNVVEAMRHYAQKTSDPAVIATVKSIEGNRNLTRRLEKIGGKSAVSGTTDGGGTPPTSPSGGGGRGGRGGGGTGGGGTPPAPATPTRGGGGTSPAAPPSAPLSSSSPRVIRVQELQNKGLDALQKENEALQEKFNNAYSESEKIKSQVDAMQKEWGQAYAKDQNSQETRAASDVLDKVLDRQSALEGEMDQISEEKRLREKAIGMLNRAQRKE